MDAQIAQTHTAIETAEKSRLREETTDQDNPHLCMGEGGTGKGAHGSRRIPGEGGSCYSGDCCLSETARQLQEKEVVQNDLLRNVKNG